MTEFNRRDLFAGTAAVAAATTLGASPLSAQAAAPGTSGVFRHSPATSK